MKSLISSIKVCFLSFFFFYHFFFVTDVSVMCMWHGRYKTQSYSRDALCNNNNQPGAARGCSLPIWWGDAKVERYWLIQTYGIIILPHCPINYDYLYYYSGIALFYIKSVLWTNSGWDFKMVILLREQNYFTRSWETGGFQLKP